MSMNLSERKIRVIAKIRTPTDLESVPGNGDSTNWISIQKSVGEENNSVSVSFGDNSASSSKDSYKLDGCYEQKEGNDLIFSNEVKPLIAEVFEGRDVTVIALGARASGKTYLIQGSETEPGLAVLAMAEILGIAEESGKSIAVSLFEDCQDNLRDVLEPKKTTVSVLEDAQGKIQLKGLSQVTVKSVSEFWKLYFKGQNSDKQIQMSNESPGKSHKGLIIYVSSRKENSDLFHVSKINFIDLAGYEDTKRGSIKSTLSNNTKINRSIYALQNVVYAVGVGETHVPYRESKLARMMKNSLRGKNKILMIACLTPTFCQSSVDIVSLVSRSCQGSNRSVQDGRKKNKIVVKDQVIPQSTNQSVLDGTKKIKMAVQEPVIPQGTNRSAADGTKKNKVVPKQPVIPRSSQATNRTVLDDKMKNKIIPKEMVMARSSQDTNQSILYGIKKNKVVPKEPVITRSSQDTNRSVSDNTEKNKVVAKQPILSRSSQRTNRSVPDGTTKNKVVVKKPVMHRSSQGTNRSVPDSTTKYKAVVKEPVMPRSSQGTNGIILDGMTNIQSFGKEAVMAPVFQGTSRVVPGNTKKTKISSNPKVLSPYNRMQHSSSTAVKKQIVPRVLLSERKAKANEMPSAVKGRKLFDEAKHYSRKLNSASKKEFSSSKSVVAVEVDVPNEVLDCVSTVKVDAPAEDYSSSYCDSAVEVHMTKDVLDCVSTVKVDAPAKEFSSSNSVSAVEVDVPKEVLDCLSTLNVDEPTEEFSSPNSVSAVEVDVPKVASNCVSTVKVDASTKEFSSSSSVSAVEVHVPKEVLDCDLKVDAPTEVNSKSKKRNLVEALYTPEITSADNSGVSTELELTSSVNGREEFTILNNDVFEHNAINAWDVPLDTNDTPKDFAMVEYERGPTPLKENSSVYVNEGGSPPLSVQLMELSRNLKSLYSESSSRPKILQKNDTDLEAITFTETIEPQTPLSIVTASGNYELSNSRTPWQGTRSCGAKNSIVRDYLNFLNTADKEDLKKLKGIGEKRATYILELREETPEPFKELDNLKDIGLSAKQIKGMLKHEISNMLD